MFFEWSQELKNYNTKKSLYYLRFKKFKIVKIGDREKVIAPMISGSDEIRYYVCYNYELYDIIHEDHISTNHGGRN